MTANPVIKPELVAHVFALLDGELAGAAEDAIRAMWSRCQTDLGATEPIPRTGLPTLVPPAIPDAALGNSVLVAAQQSHEGQVQALLRREQEVLNLSVLLANRPDGSWLDFDRQLDALLGEDGPLLGVARLYLGTAPDAADRLQELGATVDALLPGDRHAGWWHRAAAGDDIALWETTPPEGAWIERRFVALAGQAHDAELSRWTWTVNKSPAMPPFARYLMHLAKIRYQLRVRSNYPAPSDLGQRVSDTLASWQAAPADQIPVTPALAALAETVMALQTMRRTVEICWDNAAAAHARAAGDQPPFGWDHELVTWFCYQLDEDVGYLETFTEGLRRLDGIAPRAAGHPAQAAPPDAVERAHPPAPHATGRPRVLAVADEWFPRRGGVSALNRYLCIALAARAEVFCLVPASTEPERRDAAAAGVHLVDALAVRGMSERAVLLRRPALPVNVIPDAVLGHGRVTGEVARVLVADHYPNAARLHVVHTEPDQVEWYKLDRANDAAASAEERTSEELGLAGTATRAVPVGPRLDRWLRRDLGRPPGKPVPLRLDPGFDAAGAADPVVPEGVPLILLMGRVEDAWIKGVDLAAMATGRAAELGLPDTGWELVVRGAPPGQGARLRRQILDWVGHPDVDVTVREFSGDPLTIESDLRRASLVIMSSRVEGFGLVGLEALRAARPALISKRSGLGMLLGSLLDTHMLAQVVVPVLKDDAKDVPVWAHHIAAIMRDLPAAFATATAVRRVTAGQQTWAMAAERLLEAVPVVTANC